MSPLNSITFSHEVKRNNMKRKDIDLLNVFIVQLISDKIARALKFKSITHRRNNRENRYLHQLFDL
jgi:hypothetical protein